MANPERMSSSIHGLKGKRSEVTAEFDPVVWFMHDNLFYKPYFSERKDKGSGKSECLVYEGY